MRYLLSCFLLPFVSGCVDSDDVEIDVDLEETTQDLTGTVVKNYSCSSGAYCNFNIGSSTNRACFLGGIRGAAGPGSLVVIQPAAFNAYELTIYPPSAGQTITVTTVCVSPAANVTTALWNGGPSVQIPNTTTSSKCFLTKFGSEGAAMTSYNDSIQTWRDASGKWFLGGGAASGYLSGGAICFDASDRGTWSWGQGTSGSISGNLAYVNGNACGLTELGGNFTTGSSSDGVHIHINAASARWAWTLKNFKHAHAACIN